MRARCVECNGMTVSVCQGCRVPLHPQCSLFCLLCKDCAQAKDIADQQALQRARRLLKEWEEE